MTNENNKRAKTLEQVAEVICRIKLPHPIRVAIDGIDGSGKTQLADELKVPIEQQSRRVIRASIDSFHHSQEIRYKRGIDSPEGYFHDSFDNFAIINNLLGPLGPGGNRRYRLAVYDYRVDQAVDSPIKIAPKDSILLFDGVFLHRPELVSFWDFSIFLDVDIDISLLRGFKRDTKLSDIQEKEKRYKRYQKRYKQGQEKYLQEVNPKGLASLVLDNNYFDDLCLI
jgi:uridine kinase